MTDLPRKTALAILHTVEQERKTLDSVLDQVFADQPFDKRDRSFIYALVYGVLRWRERLDYVIARFSKSGMDRIRPDILNILRMGLFQMLHMDKVPASAAVNTSVNLAKESGADSYVSGFVNGLLRNVARNQENIAFPDQEKEPVSALSIGQSFPRWLAQRWIRRFGYEETQRICHALNTPAPLTIRTNTLKITRENLMDLLESEVEQVQSAVYTEEGILLSGQMPSVPEIKAFQQGCFQVQDEAAQLVTCMLNPQPGERILDACAGLGGKTGHIAQRMENQGSILAMDSSREKLDRLKSETERLGISIVTACEYDLNTKPEPEKFGMFDRVLLDAPCSGLGVIRRNPDTKWAVSEKDLARYKKRQIRFLDHLAGLVKPDGLLVYAVCTAEPEENEEVAYAFLKKQAQFRIEKNLPGLPEKARSLFTPEGFLRTFPHLHHTDGFFSVCLRCGN
ncbi:MAG: 16S rRNA (cytosine(967)-C(5))-methyltransferase RsmB [Desulfobacterales bacterium]